MAPELTPLADTGLPLLERVLIAALVASLVVFRTKSWR